MRKLIQVALAAAFLVGGAGLLAGCESDKKPAKKDTKQKEGMQVQEKYGFAPAEGAGQ